jgi:DNA-binding NtrC family response regulator
MATFAQPAGMQIESNANAEKHPQPGILVVDDDSGVRRFLVTLLKRVTGAQVFEAADPSTAFRIVTSARRPIGLLISDVELGASMNGIQLAGKVAEFAPSTRILIMSGTEPARQAIPEGWRFLLKPFSICAVLESFLDLSDPLAK